MAPLGLMLSVVMLGASWLLGGCERQGPPKPIGAATNKHVEETPASPSRGTADAMTETIQTPLNKARNVENVIQGAADRTSQQTDQADH